MISKMVYSPPAILGRLLGENQKKFQRTDAKNIKKAIVNADGFFDFLTFLRHSLTIEMLEVKGYSVNPHPANPKWLNVYCPIKGRNVIKEINTQSKKGFISITKS